VGTAAQYLLVQFLKFFIVRFYDFFIVIWLVSKQALSRLHSFAALPFSGAAPRPSEFVRAGTLLTSRELT
jgi:hypothetical protein